MGGFSLLSIFCACAGAAETADIASAHTPVTTLHKRLFIIFLDCEQPGFPSDYPWPSESVHPGRGWKSGSPWGDDLAAYCAPSARNPGRGRPGLHVEGRTPRPPRGAKRRV